MDHDEHRLSDGFWDRWEEIDRLLEQALDRPPGDRQDLLAQACGEDQTLLRAVRTLIHISELGERTVGPGGHLLRAAFGETPHGETVQSLIGKTIGSHREPAPGGTPCEPR